MTVLRKFVTASVAIGATAVIAACGSSSSGGGGGGGGSISGSGPITIGTSLSLSGDFAADGQAFQRGYQLWVADQNRAGGLLGHKIKLDVLSDSSSPSQVVSNYQKLIGSNKDQLVFGPFSSLLTVPAARIAARYGYAFVEGAGGAPSVFGAGLHNVFDVSIPIKDNLVTFAQWVASMPASQRPKTAAYATVDDPFTQPQIPVAQKILQAAGVKTVLSKVFPAEVTDYTPIASQMASTHADLAVLGSVDVPTVSAFTHAFVQQHYDPKAFIATGGPDQGAAFVKAVGAGNENGIFVPNGWYPGVKKADSEKMVQEYIAKYGGTASGVNSDVAEAYSVGQVIAQAVQATHSLDQQKITSYLKSGATFNSVQGPVKFDSLGENQAQKTLTFQWQKGALVQAIPTAAAGSQAPLYPKPAWQG
ncbi:MAG TPA: amino acid ABC transporter substrate-binding protein [Solirubrobacteraceae bacterium]|jgi:branched-chain amino acid transport system substrate-binding protein|nr:amino acid ABC transporter substrate-binding protein [Solirubrobacteraceae bacterium]